MFKSVFKTGIRAVYDVLNNPTFVSEPWYIYPAKHNTTGRAASVFIFDKSKFETTIYKLCSNMSNTKNPKVIISECYELLKFEVSQLAKLRHPQILTVYEIMEETKLKFLFVSEPVVNNLVTVNMDKHLDELSIQKGLLEICKSIQFLHNYCSIIHLNLQPSSIFINQHGDWKLSGFKFLQNLNEISPQERDNYFIMNNSSIVPFANLNLNFTPPELIIDNNPKLDLGNDIWALGCLMHYVYNKGDYLINCFDSTSMNDYKSEFRKFETKFYNHRVTDLKYVLKDIPDQLYRLFPNILARYPHDRITIDQLIDSDFFNGSLIKAMWFVDEFSTKSLDDKLIFLKGLLEVRDGKIMLEHFPGNFRTVKLLPLLIELLKGELSVSLPKEESHKENRIELVCHCFAIILKIGSGLSHLSFQDKIFDPLFREDLKVKKKDKVDYFDKLINFSVKVRLTFIENLDILIDKLNDKDLTDLIKQSSSLMLTLPSTESHYKQEQIRLQDLYLSKIGDFINKFDFPYIKNTFFPLICQVFKTTTVLSTKLATVTVFENVTEKNVIDKIIIKEQVLPIFQNLKSRDKRIVSSVLKFFTNLVKNEYVLLELETIVELVLPICLKLVFGCNDCIQSEFKMYMNSINEIQSNLVKRKLPDLPTKVPPKQPTKNQSTNFDSLINTQSINTGNLESLQTGPQSSVMAPTNKTTNSARNSASNSSAARTRRQPMLSRTTGTGNGSMGSRTPSTSSGNSDILQPKRNTRPLKVHEDEPNPKPSSLTFGATGPKETNSTRKLLNTLEGTFAKDEFLDFQSATPTSSQNSTPVAHSPAMTPPIQSQPPLTPNNAGTKAPPGFNNSILTPSSRSASNSNNNLTQGSNDLMDLI